MRGNADLACDSLANSPSPFFHGRVLILEQTTDEIVGQFRIEGATFGAGLEILDVGQPGFVGFCAHCAIPAGSQSLRGKLLGEKGREKEPIDVG